MRNFFKLLALFGAVAIAGTAQADATVSVDYVCTSDPFLCGFAGAFGIGTITYAASFDAVPTAFALDQTTGLFSDADTYNWTASNWDGSGSLTGFAVVVTDDAGTASGATLTVSAGGTWIYHPTFGSDLAGTYSLMTVQDSGMCNGGIAHDGDACFFDTDCGSCIGGPNPGSGCVDAADCGAVCAGGQNDGVFCVDDISCPGSCSGGFNPGGACAFDSDCDDACVVSGNLCASDFDCLGNCSASGDLCSDDLSCVTVCDGTPTPCGDDFECGPGVCVGGGNDGLPCFGPPIECPGGTCQPSVACVPQTCIGGGDSCGNLGVCPDAGSCTAGSCDAGTCEGLAAVPALHGAWIPTLVLSMLLAAGALAVRGRAGATR